MEKIASGLSLPRLRGGEGSQWFITPETEGVEKVASGLSLLRLRGGEVGSGLSFPRLRGGESSQWFIHPLSLGSDKPLATFLHPSVSGVIK